MKKLLSWFAPKDACAEKIATEALPLKDGAFCRRVSSLLSPQDYALFLIHLSTQQERLLPLIEVRDDALFEERLRELMSEVHRFFKIAEKSFSMDGAEEMRERFLHQKKISRGRFCAMHGLPLVQFDEWLRGETENHLYTYVVCKFFYPEKLKSGCEAQETDGLMADHTDY